MSKVIYYELADEDLLREYAIAVLTGNPDRVDLVKRIEASCLFDPHPQQPQVWVDNVLRFRQNALVRRLVDELPGTMNTIASWDGTREDQAQLAQLIGYSVSGYGGLSYALPVDDLTDDEPRDMNTEQHTTRDEHDLDVVSRVEQEP